jgi:hypothetical protein
VYLKKLGYQDEETSHNYYDCHIDSFGGLWRIYDSGQQYGKAYRKGI